MVQATSLEFDVIASCLFMQGFDEVDGKTNCIPSQYFQHNTFNL